MEEELENAPEEYAGHPLFASDVVALTQGSEVALASKRLGAPADRAFEIHRIRFGIDNPDGNDEIGGNNVSVRFDLGKHPVTNEFVPVFLFGRPKVDTVGEALEPGGAADFTREYEWILDRPLYVPAGAVLSATAKHEGNTVDTINTRVSYLGRLLPKDHPVPRVLAVPYVTAHKTKNFTLSTADTDNSDEETLRNPFDVPLHVERFMGRTVETDNASNYEYLPPEFEYDLLTLRITSSRGVPPVRDAAIFRSVFDATTRMWECPHDLPPGEFYRLRFATAAPSPGTGMAAQTARAFVSMVGWREVQAQ